MFEIGKSYKKPTCPTGWDKIIRVVALSNTPCFGEILIIERYTTMGNGWLWGKLDFIEPDLDSTGWEEMSAEEILKQLEPKVVICRRIEEYISANEVTTITLRAELTTPNGDEEVVYTRYNMESVGFDDTMPVSVFEARVMKLGGNVKCVWVGGQWPDWVEEGGWDYPDSENPLNRRD